MTGVKKERLTIKIGCCVNMVAEDAAGIGFDRIKTLAKLGYDYVELPLAQMMTLDDAAFKEVEGLVRDSGIPCLACNNFFPATMRLTGPVPTDDCEVKAYVIQALDRALRIGAKTIVFGSSGAKNIPEGFAYQAAWDQIVLILQMVDECIEGRDIRIAIEPLNKKESNVIMTAREGLELVKAVERRYIRLLIDFYHLSMEKEDISIICDAADYLQHMHLANPEGRIWPKYGDGTDYASFINALQKAGYNGCISIEAFSTDFEADAKEALHVIRRNINAK